MDNPGFRTGDIIGGLAIAVIVLTILATSIALTACGSQQSDDDQIEGVVGQHYNALANGDGEKACEVLTEPYQRHLFPSEFEYGLDCAERLEEYSDAQPSEYLDALAETEITDIEFQEEDEALACTLSPQPDSNFEPRGVFNMEKRDGEWFIASTNEIQTC